MNRRHLLDASALLALIRNEPGAERVAAVLDDGAIHSVNLAEVARKMASKGIPGGDVERMLDDLDLEIVSEFPRQDAYAAGRLASANSRLGLALGDCVCLVTAARHGATALTADHRWTELAGADVAITWIR